ncbi:DUF308 domain-containing protein [Microbacterium sp. cx-55]|uniref:HdeD family acid-resistance protein n=1 Tax=unclassified Microbacterium TaxID=2609290 RepID=UPI001CBD4346|nr:MULTISPECIES: DUF308 domain-containing protein [unclassified Microbacterium]MBZ4486449.1 DUF308 domain-containing protein [Microbacterium sp. cx-55]MCC4907421.1 DUF308 domain-containing protein [Microbacterium sp. cx-59]UGB36579.1 DUF308 domain-containing protein [Microbacterium sp. cx-55]
MTTASAEKSVVGGIRTALGIGGAVALIVGILILVWPLKTAAVGTAIIAVYAIVTGLVYAGIGVFSKTLSGWARVGHIVLGVLFVVAGVIALANLGDTTVFLAIFVGVFVGVTWIVEGVVALTTLGSAGSRGWTVFFAIVSLLAGVTLLFSPLYVALLWLFVGVSLVLLGILQIIRAFTFGKSV